MGRRKKQRHRQDRPAAAEASRPEAPDDEATPPPAEPERPPPAQPEGSGAADVFDDPHGLLGSAPSASRRPTSADVPALAQLEPEGAPEPLPETVLERPDDEHLPEGLGRLLGEGEEIRLLVLGRGPGARPAWLGVTTRRDLFFRTAPHGVEIREIPFGRRPVCDTMKSLDRWTVTVTAEARNLRVTGLSEDSARRFAAIHEEVAASHRGGAEAWATVAPTEGIWDEMRLYLDPAFEQTPDPEGSPTPPASGAADVGRLQQEWIRNGPVEPGGWLPGVATLAWLVPLALVLWMAHTLYLAAGGDAAADGATAALLSRAEAGDQGAAGILALRLPGERSATRKIAIARTLARNSPPGAAEVIVQDLFTHRDPDVRRAEIQSLLELKFGNELVARLAMPGSLKLKSELLEDLGDHQDPALREGLATVYAQVEPELRPAVLRALARLGDADFLSKTYQGGSADVRDACLDAALSLPARPRRDLLTGLLGAEPDAERQRRLKSMLAREPELR